MSCQRDLRNGVSELSFGHRPQLAIAADDQHQPLRGCKSISQPSHLGKHRSLSQHDIRNPLLVLDGSVAQSLVQDVASVRVQSDGLEIATQDVDDDPSVRLLAVLEQVLDHKIPVSMSAKIPCVTEQCVHRGREKMRWEVLYNAFQNAAAIAVLGELLWCHARGEFAEDKSDG